jgi:tRNA (guanine-N7-)-methyltransferase
VGLNNKYCSLKWLVNHYEQPFPVQWKKLFGTDAPLDVEIGFGLGEFLIRTAANEPKRHFVGLEYNWERIHRTIRALTLRTQNPSEGAHAFDNIRLLKADARIALERMFLPQSIENVYALFPCPWPKNSHIKHRLFTNDFLELVNSRLMLKGKLQVVTDFHPYVEWIKEQIPRTGFRVKYSAINPRFDTKFEKKWRRQGQKEFYEIILTKIKHIDIPLKENSELNSYKLNDFNPERFKFNNFKNGISVVLKETFFDASRRSLLLDFIVVEQNISQHFWVKIFKRDQYWRLCKAEGQQIFATPGLAKTIDLVYEAAQETTDENKN